MANVSYDRAFRVGPLTRAVFAPLAVVALAYCLSWISDRLLYIGPLDRAAFAWAVVIPVWLAAPSVAALRWRRISVRERSIAAAVVGTVIGVVAAYSYWLSVAFPDCETGAIFTPAARVLPAIIVGAVVGAAPAIGGLVGASARQGGVWTIAIRAAVAGFAVSLLAFAVLVTFLSGPACQRPA